MSKTDLVYDKLYKISKGDSVKVDYVMKRHSLLKIDKILNEANMNNLPSEIAFEIMYKMKFIEETEIIYKAKVIHTFIPKGTPTETIVDIASSDIDVKDVVAYFKDLDGLNKLMTLISLKRFFNI